MMVNPIHLHCRGNLIPRMFSFLWIIEGTTTSQDTLNTAVSPWDPEWHKTHPAWLNPLSFSLFTWNIVCFLSNLSVCCACDRSLIGEHTEVEMREKKKEMSGFQLSIRSTSRWVEENSSTWLAMWRATPINANTKRRLERKNKTKHVQSPLQISNFPLSSTQRRNINVTKLALIIFCDDWAK